MSLEIQCFIDGVALGGLVVFELELADTVSELFLLRLRVGHPDPALPLDAQIGQTLTVVLGDEPVLPTLHGIIHRVEQSDADVNGLSQYVITAGPPACLMAERTAHRIFKDLDVTQIALVLTAEYHQRVPSPIVLTVESHAVREFTVQYGESDFDFLRRILAEEGIAFWFDHARGGAMVLCDDTSSRSESLPFQLPFIPKSHEHEGLRHPHVQTMAVTATLRASEVAVRDYLFERPLVALDARARTAAPRRDEPDRYEFEVGRFSDERSGAACATRLLEERRADAHLVTCTTSIAISSGVRLTVTGHPRDDFNGELFVRSVRSHLRNDGGRNVARHSVTCTPGRLRFRPARSPKPRISGTQTGFVVTADDQEIDVDTFGRVEVEFRWDRRDLHTAGASRRVRVSQGWAGQGYGFVLIPRRSEEVLIAFLDGDPDEPIIVGRVHNGFTVSPLDLPAQKTQSIWKSQTTPRGEEEGFNLIRMEDAAGSELLEFRAQRDFLHETLRNADTSVGVDHRMSVGGSSATTVVGAHSIQSASTSVGTGAFSVSSTKASIHAQGNIDLEAGAFLNERSAEQVITTGKLWAGAKAIAQIASGVIKLLGGGATIAMQGGGIKITAPQDITIEAGGNLILKGAVVDVKGAPIKLNC